VNVGSMKNCDWKDNSLHCVFILTRVCGDIILFLNCLHCVFGKNVSLKSNKKFAIFVMLELYFSHVDLAT
jgi:hypothetical protein